MASASSIEIKINAELVNEIKRLRAAIETAVKDFESVSWGWDGDCGSGRIISTLEDALSSENAGAVAPPPQMPDFTNDAPGG
jgi:hypothetical protein